jgi:hypothetical protein
MPARRGGHSFFFSQSLPVGRQGVKKFFFSF